MTNQYKTVRTFEGKKYIELTEHEQIVQTLLDFKSALENVQGAMTYAHDSISELTTEMKQQGLAR